MRNLNTVVIEGRLTRDAELKYTNSGFAICNFSVACNDRRKKGDDWEDYAHFIDVTILGKFAEIIAPRLTKGAAAVVNGKLQQNRWQDKDGNNRSKLEVLCNEISVYDNKPNNSEDGGFQDDTPF